MADRLADRARALLPLGTALEDRHEPTDDERAALAELAERLRNTYPYPDPRYAGQMLKPPAAVVAAAAGGKQRGLEHQPEKQQRVDHGARLWRATRCQFASAASPPVPHSTATTGALVSATTSTLPSSSAHVTARLARPSLRLADKQRPQHANRQQQPQPNRGRHHAAQRRLHQRHLLDARVHGGQQDRDRGAGQQQPRQRQRHTDRAGNLPADQDHQP